MGREVVDYNPNDPDGRGIYIHGDGCVIRCDVIRAQLIHVQLGKAIAAATGSPAHPRRAGDPGRLSPKQLRYILAMCSELSVTDRALRLRMVSDIVGRPVVTLNDLEGPHPGSEASRVIDALRDMLGRVDAAVHAGMAPDPAAEPF